MRSLALSLVMIVALAGCAGGAGPSATPGTSATAAATELVSVSPSATPSAVATTAACPVVSPISVAAYLAADPACFGAHEVTLTGWEDRAEGMGGVDFGLKPAWLATGSPPWSFLMDRLGAECRPGCGSLAVHVDPGSGLRFERDGRWVVITGHRNDPRADGCALTGPRQPGIPSDDEIRQACRNAFVLTSVRDTEPPAAALPACPIAAALRVSDYLAADPACFQGRDVTLIGWDGQLPAMGLMPPLVEPAWLWGLTTVGLWTDAQPAPFDGNCTEDASRSCQFLVIKANPASNVNLAAAKGHWVRITGHREDSAAETCQFFAPDGWTEPLPDDVFARVNCRDTFVLASVVKSDPPAAP